MRTRVVAVLVALLALAVAMPAAAETKLKFAHVYETGEAFHTEALWAAGNRQADQQQVPDRRLPGLGPGQ